MVRERETSQCKEVHSVDKHVLVMHHLHHAENTLLLHCKDSLAEQVTILVEVLPRSSYLLELESQEVGRYLVGHLPKLMHCRRVHEQSIRLIHPFRLQLHAPSVR